MNWLITLSGRKTWKDVDCWKKHWSSTRVQDLATDTLRQAVDMVPESAFARLYLISAFVEAGRLEDAKQVARDVMRIERAFSTTNWALVGVQFKDRSVSEKLVDNLVKAGLPK
jgi:hypothetical protein